MRFSYRFLTVLALIGITGTAQAAPCDGTVTTHTIRVQKGGFFPTRTYTCYGDKVVFENRAGSNVRIVVEPIGHGTTQTEWDSGQFPNGVRLDNYGPNIMVVSSANVDPDAGAIISYESGPGYGRYDGEIVIGAAPTR